MHSIQKLNIDFERINKIFISHLHGDHSFGVPFFIINKWLQAIKNKNEGSLIIYGPENIETHVFQLVEMAFSKSHPCYEWAKNNINPTLSPI